MNKAQNLYRTGVLVYKTGPFQSLDHHAPLDIDLLFEKLRLKLNNILIKWRPTDGLNDWRWKKSRGPRAFMSEGKIWKKWVIDSNFSNLPKQEENPLRDLQQSMGSSCVFWVSKELITKRPMFCSSTPQYHPRPLSLSCLLSLWLLYCPSYNPSRE